MEWVEKIDQRTLAQTKELRLDDWQYDIRKLIAAVRVAEKTLDFIANSYSSIDLEFRAGDFRDSARKALAQLQNGEFPQTCTCDKSNLDSLSCPKHGLDAKIGEFTEKSSSAYSEGFNRTLQRLNEESKLQNSEFPREGES